MPLAPQGHGNSRSDHEPRSYKITVVGDGTVGKTSMLISYTQNKFPTDYIPTVFDTHRTSIFVDGTEQPVTLWDTAGQEQYNRLRYLSYPKTDCFIICFSLDVKSSFDNVLIQWYPELKNHCPNAAVILVGTKSDLKSTSTFQPTERECQKLRSKIKANTYIECSARTRENLEQVFIEAVKAIKRKARAQSRIRKLCDNIAKVFHIKY